jgi:hypothetical protein
MLTRILGASAVAVCLAGCFLNPSNVNRVPYEGEWADVTWLSSRNDSAMQWSRLTISGDSFYLALNYTHQYCDPDKVPSRGKFCMDNLDDSLPNFREIPCTPSCVSCADLKVAICIMSEETLGVQFAAGKIVSTTDSSLNFMGSATDTLPRGNDATFKRTIDFNEQTEFSSLGDDTLVLKNEGDDRFFERTFVRLR